MFSATFWVNHLPTNSRALVEFGLKDKKVCLTCIHFIRGNVMDINVFRDLRDKAKKILL